MPLRHSHAITGLILFIAATANVAAADKIKGDPAKALPIVEKLCAACHGLDGNGPVPNFPKLNAQHPEYLFREMQYFKSEQRISEVMASALVAELSEEDMANLAVYFAKQAFVPGVVTKPELVEAGKKLYLEGNPKTGVPSCDGCHEEDGRGSARFPLVAGQNVDYTIDQMKLYKTDPSKRKKAVKAMRTVADRLTEQEVEAVAQYLASMK